LAAAGCLVVSPARAVEFTCNVAYAWVGLSDSLTEDIDDTCPFPLHAQAANSLSNPAEVSSSVSVSGNTITLSHDNVIPNAEQIQLIYQEARVGIFGFAPGASFLAPAETFDVVVDWSHFDDPSDPYLVNAQSVVIHIQILRDGGSTVLLDLNHSEITAHQVFELDGLTPGEELTLYARLDIFHYAAKPATNLAKLSITVVPEPGTALLLAIGLGGCASWARRSAVFA
jgi:hypothetical protein